MTRGREPALDRVPWSAARGRVIRLGRDARQYVRRAPQSPRTLFILGCQRSGTTMLLDALGHDPDVKVFGEFSPLNAFNPGLARLWPQHTKRFGIRLRPLVEVARIIDAVRYPLVVAKPLVESHRAGSLLDVVPGSSAVWLVRSYRDVASSNVHSFGREIVTGNLAAVVKRDRGNWRSEWVPADARDLVEQHYRPDMNPFDAGALFWYLRTRLFFDLALDQDARVLLLKYEALVAEPDQWLAVVYDHAGHRWPGPAISQDIHAGSVGRAAQIDLSPEVAAACEQLWVRICALWDERAGTADSFAGRN
jgi:hypothetical protein